MIEKFCFSPVAGSWLFERDGYNNFTKLCLSFSPVAGSWLFESAQMRDADMDKFFDGFSPVAGSWLFERMAK